MKDKIDNNSNLPLCKWCGNPFVPCHKDSVFCSKSCATSYRNKTKLENGTHNFYNIDRSKIAKDRVNNGTHPFLSGNMSEEALQRKYDGISKARKQEASEHRHPWQNPKNFIENEYSRSINTAKERGLSVAILYIAETDFPQTIKIGWTYDINIRENDNRTINIHNLIEIYRDCPDNIILIEKLVKNNFFNSEYYEKYKSTEIFPEVLKNEILDFINQQRLLLKGGTS